MAPELLAVVLSGFALAAAAPWLHRLTRDATGWVLASLPLAIFGYFVSRTHEIADGEPLTVSYEWVGSLDVALSFSVDGLSLVFALLITGVGVLILGYTGSYLAHDERRDQFYAFLLFFMASMLGLVLADNVITLFVFWELTSISSYLLIGFEHERPAARDAALQALLVTGVGGLALLAGLVLLGVAGGTFELSELTGRGEAVRQHDLYLPALSLILLGAFTKSAQAPFHFWLPNAMEAPTPVSAYLHSATMVKAGVYLIARLAPALGGSDAWLYTLTIVGGATLLVGAYLALVEHDLKRILAYSTVAVLGMLTMLIGLGSSLAVTAAIVVLIGHALYKGALFLIAGGVDHATGTRDIRRLGGLAPRMPVTAVAAGAAALSMAGVPPLFGFIGKEKFLEASLHAPIEAVSITVLAVVGSTLLVAAAVVAGVRPLVGGLTPDTEHAHEASVSLWLGPILLAAGGLVVGMAPMLVSSQLVAPAVSATLGAPASVDLELWPGINRTLGLSTLALIVGIALALRHEAWQAVTSSLRGVGRWGPGRWYDGSLIGLDRLARGQTRTLQSGYLRVYLLLIIATTLGLVGFTLIGEGGLRAPGGLDGARFYEVGLVPLILSGALMAAVTNSRLAAIAALGIVGYGVALVYVLFGAPDLAMAQILVETLIVVLFVLAFYHLPRFARLSDRSTRVRDALIAGSAGALMTALVLVATSVQFHGSISDFYAQNSAPLAEGRNVVNVVLVDFRALDTLGEITVLALAAIGVYALLKLRAGKGRAP